ncbi:Gas vesicle protein [Thermomonospora echinospora]|uniref:Gas vesicle protein n=1 Tax=Thermomonospora echinospora TaxID=1992 RepID=A0A1H6CJE7_9ACTN|nr:gas vesicle protein [Thermomonospora echinospora]SEG72893.1 Gas vesicle protein [Thermomonospora echinospora]
MRGRPSQGSVVPSSSYYGGGVSHREPANLGDILERVLDKGIVIAGDIRVNLLDIELLTIKLRLLIVSVETAKELGIDWWEHDPWLSGKQRSLEEENRRLRRRLAAVEDGEREDLELRPPRRQPAEERGIESEDYLAESEDRRARSRPYRTEPEDPRARSEDYWADPEDYWAERERRRAGPETRRAGAQDYRDGPENYQPRSRDRRAEQEDYRAEPQGRRGGARDDWAEQEGYRSRSEGRRD